jgi:hypothetical protein
MRRRFEAQPVPRVEFKIDRVRPGGPPLPNTVGHTRTAKAEKEPPRGEPSGGGTWGVQTAAELLGHPTSMS